MCTYLMLIIVSIIMVTAVISQINMAGGSTMASMAMIITNFYYNIKSSVVRYIGLYNGSDGMYIVSIKQYRRNNEASYLLIR